jgi:hypothetical protein
VNVNVYEKNHLVLRVRNSEKHTEKNEK